MTDTSSRTVSTKPDPYDLIIALSQKHLNDNFLAFWGNHPEYHVMKIRNAIIDINALLKAPTIEILVTDESASIIFTINFESGTLQVFDISAGDNPHDHPLGPPNGWSLNGQDYHMAITSDIVLKEGKDSRYFNQIEGRPEDYSFSTLFFDLTTAGLATPLLNKTNLPPGCPTDSTFTLGLEAWFKQLHASGASTLGAQARAKGGTNPLAALEVPDYYMPKTLHFQAYGFQAEPNTRPDDVASGDYNCLVYAQMTTSSPEPSHYFYTGNLVEPGGRATLLMTRRNFWDKWLLPKLQKFNFATWLTGAYTHNSGREGTEDWDWGYKFGADALSSWNDDANAKDFNYKGYQWNKKAPGTDFGFWWNPGLSHDESHHGVPGSEVKNDLDLETRNDISFTPGSANQGVITVSGTTTGKAMCHTDARGTGWYTAVLTWSFTIKLLEIVDADPNKPGSKGGLVTKLDWGTKPNVNAWTDHTGNMSYPSGIGDSMKGKLDDTTAILSQLEKELSEALKYEHMLVLPAQGTFYMRNPVLNNNGDLLVDLEYKPTLE